MRPADDAPGMDGGSGALTRLLIALFAVTTVVTTAVVLLAGPRRPDTGLYFGQDFRIYYDAAREAAAGGNPYLPYDIGTGSPASAAAMSSRAGRPTCCSPPTRC